MIVIIKKRRIKRLLVSICILSILTSLIPIQPLNTYAMTDLNPLQTSTTVLPDSDVVPLPSFIPPATLKFHDFNNAEDMLMFNGVASINDGALQLENINGLSGGSIFTKNKLSLGSDMSFITSFAFTESHISETVGGGGFVFVVQPTDNTVYGTETNSLGTSGITPSLSIGIESVYSKCKDYNREYEYWVNYNVSIIINGDYENPVYQKTTADFMIDDSIVDGTPVRAFIGYNDFSKSLNVSLASTNPYVNEYYSEFIINNIDLNQILTSEDNEVLRDVYAGFTGSTGDASEICMIKDWYFANGLDDVPQFYSETDLDVDWWYEEGEAIILNENSAFDEVTSNLNLPSQLPNGSPIIWKSSNMFLIETDGTVNRPTVGEQFQDVTLSYRILDVFGETYESGDYILKVKRLELDDAEDITGNIPVSLKFDNSTNLSNVLQTNALGTINADGVIQFDSVSSGELGGSVFTKNKIHLNENQSFSTTFLFAESYEANPVGDGGFAFTMQTVSNSVYGTEASTLGTSGIIPSISIGIESEYVMTPSSTSQGFDYFEDYYILIIENGDYSNPLYREKINYPIVTTTIRNGIPVRGYVEYNGDTKNLKVKLVSTKPDYSDYSYLCEIEDIYLSKILVSEESEPSQDVYVGFTGSTGDVDETCKISDWYFKNSIDFIELDNYTYKDATNISLTTEELGDSTSVITVTILGSPDSEIPASGVQVDFATSLGTVYPSSVTTDAFGKADAILISDTEGIATLEAFAQGGAFTSAQVQVNRFDLSILDDQSIVDKDSRWLTDRLVLNGNSSFNNVTGSLEMPKFGPFGSTIIWQISDSNTVSPDGIITRPTFGEMPKEVHLTAVISKGDKESIKEFLATVKASSMSSVEKVAEDSRLLTAEMILNENISLDCITSNVTLPTIGFYGSMIEWQSNSWHVDVTDGSVNRVEGYHWGDEEVTLTATISQGEVSQDKIFTLTVKNYPPTDYESVEEDRLWLSPEIIIDSENDMPDEITENLNLPIRGPNGSIISWHSSNTLLIAPDGTVNRPEEGDPFQEVTLTATLKRGEDSTDVPLTLSVKKFLFTDEDKISEDEEWLTSWRISNENNSLDNVKSSLYLPTSGYYGSTISWSSSNEEVVSPDGIVYRKSNTYGDVEVTLKATISAGDALSVEKTFIVIVKAYDITDSEMLEEAKTLLTEDIILNANTSLDNITVDLNLPVEGAYSTDISWSSTDEVVVSTNGEVTRPLFGEEDKEVILTATISTGSEQTQKTFIVIVKAEYFTDLEIVNNVKVSLTEDIILNGNTSLDNITGDLNLPVQGIYSTDISWVSTDEAVISTSGEVTRPPLFSEEDKEIILTATITRGSEQAQKTFVVMVKQIEPTDLEAVNQAVLLLTEDMILGANSSLNNITGDLNLLVKGGFETTISWVSTDEAVISTNGEVTRPPLFSEGDKEVELTATISRGSEQAQKTFVVTVKQIEPTDLEAINQAVLLLTEEIILNHNSSLGNIISDLNLPVQGAYSTDISWVSTDETVILPSGEVIRPQIDELDKEVILTATISRGSEQAKKAFTVTVKAEEAEYIKLIETLPTDGETDVLYNKRQIIFTFDRDIKPADKWGNIQIGYYNNNEFVEVNKICRINNNKMFIDLSTDMEFGKLYNIFIPREAICDKFEYPLLHDIDLSYTVEKQLINNIKVLSSWPSNGQKDVGTITEIRVLYNNDDTHILKEGESFEDIKVISSLTGEEIPITKTLARNNVYITFESSINLKEAEVYEVIMPYGAVIDRYNNESETKSIQFKMKADLIGAKVSHVYPADGVDNVDINQSIEIVFSEKVKRDKTWTARLVDEEGNRVATGYGYDFVGWNYDFVNKLFLEPIEQLKPQTTYRVIVGNESFKDSANNFLESTYEMSFTTGKNSLQIDEVNIKDKENDVAIDTEVIIDFSSPVIKSEAYNEIKIRDSKGYNIGYQLLETGNRVSLTPDEVLETEELYTVEIPYGAYRDTGTNEVNDSYKMSFTTAMSIYEIYYPKTFQIQPRRGKVFTNTPISFSGFEIKYSGYSIESYLWDFGDNTFASGKTVEHSYVQPGDYEVTLKIVSNKGTSMEYSQSVSVIDTLSINPSEVDMKVWYSTRRGSLVLENTDSGHFITSDDPNRDFEVFIIDLSYNGITLPQGQSVSAQLYKEGELIKQYWNVITRSDGRAYFYFDYHYLDGYYDLNFIYGDSENGREVSFPVNIMHSNPKTIDIELYIENYNRSDYELPPSFIELDVNGELRRAYNCGNSYQLDLSTGRYEIQLSNSDENYFSDNSNRVLDIKDNTSITMVVKKKPIGLPDIGLVYGDYTRRTIFIEGVKREVNVTVNGDWNYHPEGYIEVKTSKGIIRKENMSFTLDVGSMGVAGERIQLRMVSKDGICSNWVDSKIEVAPPPPMTPLSEIIFKDGCYELNMDAKIEGFTEGKIGTLDKIPLLNSSESFGISESNNNLEGYISRGDVTYTMALNNNQEVSFLSTGTKISGSLYAKIHFKYDYDENIWKFKDGYIAMLASSETKLEKDVVLCTFKGIEIGPTITTIITHRIGGQLNLNIDEQNKKEYTGVLYYAPSIDFGIDASIANFGIEGWGGGTIETQLHIPTWYVQVDPFVYIKVIAKYFLGESTIFYESASATWNNGREQVPSIFGRSYMLSSFEIPDEVTMEPISRDYLNYPTMMTTRSIRVPQIKENIYPYADVKMVNNQDETWMTWIDDNPERSSMNRTQMIFSVLEDGVWSQPEWMDYDGTNDFNPVLASNGNGVLVAWQDINKSLPESTDMETMDAFTKNSEISVTQSVYQSTNSDVNIVTLTDDEKYDHSPNLAADGNHALLAWIKSDDSGDSLLYSSWDGSEWGEPEAIAESLPTVIDTNLSLVGNQGLLLYTLDMDNDIDTTEDLEIFARVYNAGSWEETVRITNNEVLDSSPKAVYYNNEWFITWFEDTYIMYRNGLNAENQTTEFLTNVHSDFDIEIKESGVPQIALIYKSYRDNNQRELSMVLYDVNKDLWSDEILLTENNEYIRSFDGVFTDEGELKVAYTEAQMITETIDGKEYTSPSDKVDLKTLSYTPVHDLALNEELVLSNENPIMGSMVTITAKIENQGDYAEDATVFFYNGNPDHGGIKIGEIFTERPIPARTSTQLEVQWVVGTEEVERYDIYAVVKPDDSIVEVDESNNTIIHTITCADVEIADVEWENVSKDDYLVTLNVLNKGSKSLEGINVHLQNALNNEYLESKTIDKLEPLQRTSVDFLFSASGLEKDENGKINMKLSAMLGDGIEEFSTENNNYTFELELKPIEVHAINIAQGETIVDVNQLIIIDFNMGVEQGVGYEQIILEDNLLNRINISKTLEGNTLTLTPQSSMDYSTSYTLTIPKDAFGDSYGHTMNSSYKLKFVTESSSPEVIMAYPGEGIKNVAIDSEIKMMFNQDISEGITFENITLKDEYSQMIPANVSIQGEWLYLNPAINLDNNIGYTVSIPAGAINNDRDQLLNEEYLLNFETKQDVEKAKPIKHNNEKKPIPSIKTQVGNEVYEIGQVKAIIVNGEEVANVTVDTEKLQRCIDNIKENATITISVDTPSVQVDLNLQDMKNLQEKGLVLEVKSTNASYELKASQIDIETILEDLGEDIDFKDIIFSISIKKTDETMLKVVENAANKNELSIVVPPLDFEIEVTYGDKTVTVDHFNRYVKRMIRIPEGTDIDKITTAIITDEEGNIRQVPTLVMEVDGKYYAVINSMTNSTYTLIYNEVSYRDIEGYWAEADIVKMGSRLIFEESEAFEPERIVTRAGMVKALVKALGLAPQTMDLFTDIPLGSDYAGYIGAAYEFGITNGTSETTFSPDLVVTREQVMTFVYRIAKAIDFTGTDNIIDMTKYVDYSDVSDYAKEAVMWNVTKGIIVGTSETTLSPKDYLTKAQVAAIVNRFLMNAGLID